MYYGVPRWWVRCRRLERSVPQRGLAMVQLLHHSLRSKEPVPGRSRAQLGCCLSWAQMYWGLEDHEYLSLHGSSARHLMKRCPLSGSKCLENHHCHFRPVRHRYLRFRPHSRHLHRCPRQRLHLHPFPYRHHCPRSRLARQLEGNQLARGS